jgi:CRISPR-associated protein Cas5t
MSETIKTERIWLQVTVPIASFAVPQAREFVESYPFPPPSTVYGMLLSMIGETNRKKYIGTRLSVIVSRLAYPNMILRKIRRVKKADLNDATNSRPDYQTLLTGLEFFVGVESPSSLSANLIEKIRSALKYPESIHRFGGLSCGESHNLVDQINLVSEQVVLVTLEENESWVLKPNSTGDWSVQVWVDHVGSLNTVWERASFEPVGQLEIKNLDFFEIRAP